MTDPSILDIRLLPDPLRATIAAGYRDLASANRMLFAETGTPMYREWAEYAEGRAEAMTAGVSLLFDMGGLPCIDP